ncbi:hypothetical protein NUW58_g9114 [Xylaria curta]|uniref:Uncharacterized protein n=1 Tax=Xylaria curta TaxID=42375 RepID=A0ACC1N0J9_9PEZI|nr:hypothetical protein NUW58_g9114 [Xylaria curta]
MVLLTMTPSMVEALIVLKQCSRSRGPSSDTAKFHDVEPEEPCVKDPAVGKPISHGQILDTMKTLKANGHPGFRLEDMLRGSALYVPPPPPKPEPTDEYKALMARLRREEEERSYERMLRKAPPRETFAERYPLAPLAHSFAEVNKPSKKSDIEADDIEFGDVQKQMTLIINFLVSVFGCGAALWKAAQWWPVSTRLFLSLGGAIIVAITEVAVYSAYTWRMSQGEKKQAAMKEVREVVKTWVVSEESDQLDPKDPTSIAPDDSHELETTPRRSFLDHARFLSNYPGLSLTICCALESPQMELYNVSPKEVSRIPRKPERPYISSLRSCSMETRRRPLRTYSKRTLSTESADPTPKRRCIAGPPTASVQDEDTRITHPEPGNCAPAPISNPLSSLPPAKKGTITAYFGRIIPQPRASTPPSDLSSDPLSDSNGSTTTPPSSPPIIPSKRRGTRRLKTRVVVHCANEQNASDGKQEDQDSQKQTRMIHDSESPTHACASPPSETTLNIFNQTENTSEAPSERDKSRVSKRQEKKQMSVQTTLSLSMNETHYTECKECGMLYNHLHEADVKYHARRHAALRRAKTQAGAKSDLSE